MLASYFTTGKLERTGATFSWRKRTYRLLLFLGSSITERIGQGRVTSNLQGAPVDYALSIPDEETITMVFRLLHEEGFFVGASSGLNVVAAVEVAKKLGTHSLRQVNRLIYIYLFVGPGHTIVTVLCDGASRYQSRLLSKKWLTSKNLLTHVPKNYWTSLSE